MESKPSPQAMAVYRLTSAPDMAALRKAWNSLSPDMQRQTVEVKNLVKTIIEGSGK